MYSVHLVRLDNSCHLKVNLSEGSLLGILLSSL